MTNTDFKPSVPRLTKEQAIILTGFTGIAFGPFSHFHEDVEKRLGRPVWTHEFASEDLMNHIKELYKEDFLSVCFKGE